MAKILDFEAFGKAVKEKKQINKVIEDFALSDRNAGMVIEKYRNLVRTDVRAAITDLPKFINEVRHCQEISYEAYVGGPNQDWVGPILSAIGDVYPNMEKRERTQILRLCMDYLDRLNYFNAQNHVAWIDDPWLVSDILVTRPRYNCGFSIYEKMIKENPLWSTIYEKMTEVRSAFFMAFAMSQKNIPTANVRRNFYKTFPRLMDLTLDGIAAIVAEKAEAGTKEDGISVENHIEENLFKYDPKIVPKIIKKIEEKKWIKLDIRYDFV